MEKSADAFRTISEVAEDLALPQHVLRFWETRFPQVRPLKRAGGRRYYRPADVILLQTIRQLLYDEGYTIKGVQRLLKEQGTKAIRSRGAPQAADPFVGLADAEDELALAEPALIETEAPREPLPDSIRAALVARETTAPGPGRTATDVEALRDALATIEECERILKSLGD